MIQIESGATNTSKPTVLSENLFGDGTVFPSTSEADAPALNAVSEGTGDFWRATALPATYTLTLTAAEAADCFCIAAHDIGTQEATAELEYFNGSVWVSIATITPTDNSTIMALFASISADQWRLTITGANNPPAIGYMALGSRTVLQAGIVGDYTPTDWAERVEIFGGQSVSGQFLPQREKSYGGETTINLGRVVRSWFETSGRAFQRHFNRGRSFFFAGWPDTLVDDIALCWRPPRAPEMRPRIVEGGWVVMSMDVDFYAPNTEIAAPVQAGDWLLATGNWDDTGSWDDSANWQD